MKDRNKRKDIKQHRVNSHDNSSKDMIRRILAVAEILCKVDVESRTKSQN